MAFIGTAGGALQVQRALGACAAVLNLYVQAAQLHVPTSSAPNAFFAPLSQSAIRAILGHWRSRATA
eukprot:13274755-Alexandrium_andersonii.AAC.1